MATKISTGISIVSPARRARKFFSALISSSVSAQANKEERRLTATFFLALSFVLSMFFASFLPIAIAAPAKAETQPAPSPSIGEAAKPVAPLMGEGKGERVIFTKGLLTVQAKDVTLKSLLEEIGQKAGIGAESSPSLGNHKISVQFESLTLEKGLRAILQSAGVVNYALVYAQSQQPGKIGKWVIDKIYLKEEGTSNDATKVTKTQEKKPQGKVSLDKEPLDKKPLDKEPFFDKKLDRFVEVVKGEVLVLEFPEFLSS